MTEHVDYCGCEGCCIRRCAIAAEVQPPGRYDGPTIPGRCLSPGCLDRVLELGPPCWWCGGEVVAR